MVGPAQTPLPASGIAITHLGEKRTRREVGLTGKCRESN